MKTKIEIVEKLIQDKHISLEEGLILLYKESSYIKFKEEVKEKVKVDTEELIRKIREMQSRPILLTKTYNSFPEVIH